MQLNYPKTWSYLKQFEAALGQRKARGVSDMVEKGAPFYTMFAISDYTFAPHKVVWPWISTEMRAAVVSAWEGRPVIPEHNTSFVDCTQKTQAHFICSLLNSIAGDSAIRSYYSGGGGIGSPRVLENIRIPKFDPRNRVHLKLAQLSGEAHHLAATGEDKALKKVEEEIDRLSGQLWDLSDDDLSEIQNSLDEIN